MKKKIVKKTVKKARNIETFLALKNAGKSYREIEEITGTDHVQVYREIAKLLPNDETEEYKKHRADIFAEAQRKILVSCTPKDLKKSSFKDKIISTGILFDKERLERNLSTNNHSILFSLVEAACQSRGEGLIVDQES
jgi:hypothetical protein